VIVYPGDEPHPVTIGGYCSIAANVEFIIGGNHHTERVSTFPFPGAGHPMSKGPITVGSDVWIGKNVLILSGVTVGSGAAIGANSVVTRDVRPYAIVAGNPARELRRRFADDDVARLLEIAWWTWPHDEVLSVAHLLTGTDVSALLAYADRRAGHTTVAAP
jgi:acetyltransferase-like isoleucine patch superfamily enzyme